MLIFHLEGKYVLVFKVEDSKQASVSPSQLPAFLIPPKMNSLSDPCLPSLAEWTFSSKQLGIEYTSQDVGCDLVSEIHG